MTVDEVEGSFKLNQHKSDADYAAIATELGHQPEAGAKVIADEMRACARNCSKARARHRKRRRSRKEPLMAAKKRVGILGASGYTGARRGAAPWRGIPTVEIAALTANAHAGKAMDEVFPHFFMLDLPRLVEWEKVDWTELDAVFCGLPHGTTQEIIAAVMAANPAIKILDMSADFRLRDMSFYAQWYGHAHRAPALQGEAVYGLTEFYREKITAARLVACPGCYPTAALLALVPDRESETD